MASNDRMVSDCCIGKYIEGSYCDLTSFYTVVFAGRDWEKPQ
jgi:hypothetical protein